MKLLLPILISIIFSGCSSTSEPHLTFIFDNEEILTVPQEATLDSLFRAHELKTSNEIVLVTTPDWGKEDNALFFSVYFGREHGIGKADKNNGVVIVFSKNQRQTRISTGYGIEEILRDEKAKMIIDSLMIPKFKNDEIYEGLYAGSKAIVHFLEQPGNEVKPITK